MQTSVSIQLRHALGYVPIDNFHTDQELHNCDRLATCSKETTHPHTASPVSVCFAKKSRGALMVYTVPPARDIRKYALSRSEPADCFAASC